MVPLCHMRELLSELKAIDQIVKSSTYLENSILQD